MSTTITSTAEAATSALPKLELNNEDLSKYDFSNLEPYVHPPETKAELPWSELVTLDLEDYSREGGKERLAKQLEHAVHHVGFVSLPSHFPIRLIQSLHHSRPYPVQTC
jgi:hypothetical protein